MSIVLHNELNSHNFSSPFSSLIKLDQNSIFFNIDTK